MVAPADPATVLFGRTRQAILSLMFTRPDESFYLREIVRRTECGMGPVQREIVQLTGSGILVREKQRFFRANPNSPLFDPLKQIVIRTIGIADVLRDALSPLRNQIQAAFVFGSFARGDHRGASDVDLMIIAKSARLGLDRITPLLRPQQIRLGREINPFVIDIKELHSKLRARNHFIQRVLESDKIILYGDADELGRLAEKRPCYSRTA